MKKLTLPLLLVVLQVCALSQTHSGARPRILGIDHVSFYTTAPDGVKKLYSDVLGIASAAPVESGCTVRYVIGTQWVGYSAAPDAKATDRMDHVAFLTDKIVALRRYLADQGLKPSVIQTTSVSDHSLIFSIADPEGHRIEFVQRGRGHGPQPPASSAVSRHMIHTGFLVYHQEAEDHFYRDILGFRPYWHGGMKDDVTEWLAIQVPDGTDWLEYMLNVHNPDVRELGVMHHLALGVPDVKSGYELAIKHGYHSAEKPQIGRDGKWQFNLYDPDFTRVELMEPKAVQTPCCSPMRQ